MEKAVVSYIERNQHRRSRYEIDLSLLRAGYTPEQIEKAWVAVSIGASKYSDEEDEDWDITPEGRVRLRKAMGGTLKMLVLTVWVAMMIFLIFGCLLLSFTYQSH